LNVFTRSFAAPGKMANNPTRVATPQVENHWLKTNHETSIIFSAKSTFEVNFNHKLIVALKSLNVLMVY